MSAALQEKPEIKIKLSVTKGPHAGQVFQLNKLPIQIGRGPENDIVLLNDPQASRNHAQIALVDREIEVHNLSQKNAVFVDGQSVQKWKIVNNSTFTVGESEFQVEYDLGQAVVSVSALAKPQNRALASDPSLDPSQKAEVIPLKSKANKPNPAKKPVIAKPQQRQQPTPGVSTPVPQQRGAAPALRQQQVARPTTGAQALTNPRMNMPLNQQQMRAVGASGMAAQTPPQNSLTQNSRLIYYLISAIVVMAMYLAFSNDKRKTAASKKVTSALKYEDEVDIKMNSKPQKDADEERQQRYKEKRDSPMSARVEENFVRGMRDFQLGQYTRAQEFFQLVLNLDPDNKLAQRYLYLCRVRFDELVQQKLMLGESYFKSHNYKLCISMYTQVINMLQGKSYDQKYQLAQKKVQECEFADEGVY
jgi:pSer/pThr/pTyr-binding forkhead associated (FHA) protein